MVVGYNPEIQKNIKIGKKNNQNFVNIPTGDLVYKLEYLTKFYGIVFKRQEESYTSKASFFDFDDIPVYDENDTKTYSFSGKRISRGQYKTAKGIILNADLNGALNILTKSSLGGSSLTILQCSGNLDMPLRIRVA